MISAPPRLSRVLLATALAAFAASGAAAAGNMFLKLHDIAGESRDAAGRGHGEEIDVHSIQWGSASAARGTFKGEVAGIEPAYRSSGDSKARGGTDTVDKDEKITIHGGRTEGDTDRPVIIGRLPNPPKAPMQYNPKELTISKDNNLGSASGADRPMGWDVTTQKKWDSRATPAAKGSVWVRMSSPWAGCRVGKRYPSLELGEGGKTYTLQDVTVANCGRSGDADDRPTEEVAFYYNKIVFNAANKMSRPAE